MDRALTNAELAILGLLVEQPCHGYDLERMINERGMRDWTELAFSSIYYVLKRLQQRGLIESTSPADAPSRSRKTFAPTEAGFRHHRQAVERALAVPQPVYPALLLGLANWPAMGAQAGLGALSQRKAALLDLLAQVTAKTKPQPDFVDAMFDYSIRQIQAELDWIETTIQKLGTTPMKIDLKKQMKSLYQPSPKEPVLVDVPAMAFLMIDGRGDPNTSPVFAQAVEALYSVAYPAKFIAKAEQGTDFVVMPLEALWWTDGPDGFDADDKDNWNWTAMIMQPEWMTQAIIDAARAKAEKKLGRSLPDLRFESFAEGRAAQILHIGPFSEEGPTIERLHQFVKDQGLSLSGRHHEIYLSDMRRTKPERLKTVIRQPVG